MHTRRLLRRVKLATGAGTSTTHVPTTKATRTCQPGECRPGQSWVSEGVHSCGHHHASTCPGKRVLTIDSLVGESPSVMTIKKWFQRRHGQHPETPWVQAIWGRQWRMFSTRTVSGTTAVPGSLQGFRLSTAVRRGLHLLAADLKDEFKARARVMKESLQRIVLREIVESVERGYQLRHVRSVATPLVVHPPRGGPDGTIGANASRNDAVQCG